MKAGKLKWRFDASTFKLLGRGLITDRITAIYELVKNCYDANSTVVELVFESVESRSAKSKIIIRDNGLGMSLADIRDKWLVVGTSSKRTSHYSPKPFNRRYIGEKGVGRFATDKLGEHLKIKTKRARDKQILSVTINWNEYESLSSQTQLMFTDLENEYEFIDDDLTFEEGQGTELIVTMLHEAWGREMILRLYNQLAKINPPIYKVQPPFDIFLQGAEFGFSKQKIEAEPIESLATIHVEIPFDYEKQKQGTLFFNTKEDAFEIKYIDKQIFGPVQMTFFYFDGEAQKLFKSKYKNTENQIEGAKIYRDGVICTPFAEYESGLDARRDILGIDKRRYSDAFEKLSTRQFIGVINITRDGNPDIIDSTNRQDFVDNDAYRRLKSFIIEQLDVLIEYTLVKREDKKVRVQNNLKRASADVKDIGVNLAQIVKARPELKDVLGPTIEKARQATAIVYEGVKEQQDTEKEFLRKEALYLSLMSLQDFANDLAHGIRFALAPAKHASEFLAKNYPNPKYEVLYLKYAKLIYSQTEKISELVDFMLSYAQVDLMDSTFTVQQLLDSMFAGAYSVLFEKEEISVEVQVQVNIELTGKRKFLEDVLSNLISNSRKALKNTQNKKILCESYVTDNTIIIIVSDNGAGIDKKIERTMFEMFQTTTADEGGSGLGLFIAKKRMKSLNGTIESVPSVFAPDGASFKIMLPLKKSENDN
jgi:signal transduction histidine kinase